MKGGSGGKGCHPGTEAFLSDLCCVSQEAHLPDFLPRNDGKHLYIYLTIMKSVCPMNVYKGTCVWGHAEELHMSTHVKLSTWEQEEQGTEEVVGNC